MCQRQFPIIRPQGIGRDVRDHHWLTPVNSGTTGAGIWPNRDPDERLAIRIG